MDSERLHVSNELYLPGVEGRGSEPKKDPTSGWGLDPVTSLGHALWLHSRVCACHSDGPKSILQEGQKFL